MIAVAGARQPDRSRVGEVRTEHDGAVFLDVLPQIAEPAGLFRTTGRVVLRIKVDDHVLALGGARLIFQDALPVSIPDESQIELNHPEAEPVYCQPVWQGSQEMGIRFDFSEESLGLISICIRNMIDLDQASIA